MMKHASLPRIPTTIKVREVRAINEKKGLVYDENGTEWQVWRTDYKTGGPSKTPLEAFVPGETISLAYTEGAYDGKPQFTVREVYTSTSRPAQQPVLPVSKPTRAKADPTEVESMCVWSLTCAYVSAGVGFEKAYADAQKNYAKVRGNPKIAESEDVFEDEIPFTK